MSELEEALHDLTTRWPTTEGQARQELIYSIYRVLSWQASMVWSSAMEHLAQRKSLDDGYLSDFREAVRSRAQGVPEAILTCHADVVHVRADLARFSKDQIDPPLEVELRKVEPLLLATGVIVRVEWMRPLVPGALWVCILCTWRVSWGLYTGITRIRTSASRHEGQQMVLLHFPGFGSQISVTLNARAIAALIECFDPGSALRNEREIPKGVVVLESR